MTLDEALGFQLTDLEPDVAHAHVEIDDRHRQPLGVVHGGVYAALAESLASHATAVAVLPDGHQALGLSNLTSFFRPVSSGLIRAEATRLHRGRTTWVWDVRFTDATGALCATSRITVAVRPAEPA
ncbi:MAG: 1,4-dihydroxy-2-naphthoyl-CoA hydrolase [Gaiellaceae bacterium]|nr:1,4-dihydroxy-2-naphthoyl-CoA hydrolase [Gaiellaceae bacterium]